ncbi:MAG: acyl carrier protein [Clostridia bacterium]|nr:acyl carrier protein [Clostridia bacterium]
MDIFEKLSAIVKDVMNTDADLTADTRLNEDLKADSLDKVSMLMRLEEEFDIEIDDDKALQFKTVGDVAEYVKDAIA